MSATETVTEPVIETTPSDDDIEHLICMCNYGWTFCGIENDMPIDPVDPFWNGNPDHMCKSCLKVDNCPSCKSCSAYDCCIKCELQGGI